MITKVNLKIVVIGALRYNGKWNEMVGCVSIISNGTIENNLKIGR